MNDINVVVIVGRLARRPEERELPSGDRLAAYEVTIERPNERDETVPVVWNAAPANATHHDTGDQVLVVGRVRRRFFRTGAGTQSRTEVVASLVANANETERVSAALAEATAVIAAATSTGSAIHRTVFTVEVFSRGPLELADGTDWLAEVNYQITDGPCIGNVERTTIEVVPPEQVEATMRRIGNDGSFFDPIDTEEN